MHGSVGSVRERRGRAAGGPPAATDTSVRAESQVDHLPIPFPGNPRARYPIVHPLDLHGTVIVQVIIDTAGFVVPGSVTLLHSSNDRLTRPVLDVVPQLRFVPADSHHRTVKVRTELTFSYPPPSPTIPGIIRPLVGPPS